MNIDGERIEKIIKFSTVSKTSQYPDRSWELQTKSGNKYRFRVEDSNENDEWYSLVMNILDPNVKDINMPMKSLDKQAKNKFRSDQNLSINNSKCNF